ncbi:YggT family protein [Noviherbaspirillum sp. 1P10PC]|uniref:YggT family protein n=1 Tax=Noviherbaspirillum sp. 1P10PC TaxID=3132292 RepID=UPI0039A155A5
MLYSIFGLIVDTVTGILGALFLLRFWMQAVRVRPPMSFAHFMFQATDWLVKPLRRLLPGVGGYDWASLIGAFLMIMVSVALDLLIAASVTPQALIVLSLLRLVQWILYGLMGLLLIEVIFSWVNPHAPLAPLVRAMNEPMMRPLRRIIPLMGGIDLSPIVAFLLLRIALSVSSALLLPLAF